MPSQRSSRLRRVVAPGALLLTLAGLVLGYHPAVAQQLPQPVVGRPGELLANGGFDVGDRAGHPIGWSVNGDSDDARIVNLIAYRTAGLGSLQIQNAVGSPVSVTSDRVVAAPGTEYTVHAQLKGKSGAPAVVSMAFTSFEGTVLDTKVVTPSFSTDWQDVSVAGVAPQNTAHVSVAITANAAAGASYWDEATLTAAAPPYDPQLGTARELFLDNYRIDSASNVGRVVHPADKLPQPVLRAEYPWESSAYIYGSVYKIGKTYRMWYTATNDVAPGYFLCYAESTDGRHWVKPLGRGNVGYKDIPASQTNIVMPGGGTVAYNPSAPTARRYALLNFQTGVVNQTLGYYAWFSPDGYTWTRGQEAPVLLDGDVSNVTWDARTQRYIATIKKRMFTSRTPGIYDRSAFISTSKDFLSWTAPQLAVSGDYADDGAAEAMNGLEGQIYGMPVLSYESTYIGVPWVLLISDYVTGAAKAAGDGPVLPEIASSRDLVTWERPVRDPILTPGQPGAWDDGTLYTASDVIVDDKTISMYYGGFNVGHGGPVVGDPDRAVQVGQTGLATWRRDGFVSLTNASIPGTGDPGVVTTKPVAFTGTDLHVNAVVRHGGSLRVEVLDAATGTPIPGYTAAQSTAMSGDQLDAKVGWSGGKTLADFAGQQVQLRFYLTNTDLYSYWIAG
jgi:hypothetical protein